MKTWKEARDQAEIKANESGHDYGLEFNKLFKTYNIFMLPAPQHRYGHELTCEVVPCIKRRG